MQVEFETDINFEIRCNVNIINSATRTHTHIMFFFLNRRVISMTVYFCVYKMLNKIYIQRKMIYYGYYKYK